MYEYITYNIKWLGARLWYLQCDNNGDTTVFAPNRGNSPRNETGPYFALVVYISTILNKMFDSFKLSMYTGDV